MTSPEALAAALDRLKGTRPELRKALSASAIALAIALADERDVVEQRLETRWKWLNANPGHPQFVEREDAVLADLKRYEAIQDQLIVAADVLFGEAA